MSQVPPLGYNAFERPHCYLRDEDPNLVLYLVIPLGDKRQVNQIIVSPPSSTTNICAITIEMKDNNNVSASNYATSISVPKGSVMEFHIMASGVTYILDANDAIIYNGIPSANQICELCPYLYLGMLITDGNGTKEQQNAPKVMIYIPNGYTYQQNINLEGSVPGKIEINQGASQSGWYFPQTMNVYTYPHVGDAGYYDVEVVNTSRPPAGTNKQKHKRTGLLPFVFYNNASTPDLKTISSW